MSTTMTVTTQKFTFQEYLTYEDGTDTRYELVDGELVPMSVGTGVHAAIIEFLSDCFKAVISDLEGSYRVSSGSVGVRSPRGGRTNTSRIPDITVLTEAQLGALWNREAIIDFDETPPLLVVEVTSPSTQTEDYRAKQLEYNVREIPEYWIVDPLSELVTICLLEDGLYTLYEFRGEESLQSSLFPSLDLTAAQVLAAGRDSAR
jgi:Uma2 family endonuclease